MWRNLPRRIGRHITVRQVYNLLGIEPLLIERRDPLVRDDVVDARRAARGGQSEIADLYRGRAEGQDSGPRVVGVAGDVDGDVDGQIAYQLGGLTIAVRPYIMKMVDGPCHALPG